MGNDHAYFVQLLEKKIKVAEARTVRYLQEYMRVLSRKASNLTRSTGNYYASMARLNVSSGIATTPILQVFGENASDILECHGSMYFGDIGVSWRQIG
ncbi:unnamed protein product [Arabis nemorensis]|uniref:Uncharacterized protein n=1 Tax=Arabis nemorensis TaxID=586526 RepID=A0A565AL77_9BRAS|nr:unnamed protein product [Arabis nemorensis]